MLTKQRIMYATWVAALFAVTSSQASCSAQQSTAMRPDTRAAAVIDTMAIRAHTRFLADDKLLGRGTGTAGERTAAAYIATQLRNLRVQPLGASNSYLLPVPLRSAVIRQESRLSIQYSDEIWDYEYGGINFIANTGGANAFRDFAGKVLFAGTPASALPLLRASTALRGNVVAFNGPLGGDAVAIVPLLIERGATGVVILLDSDATYDLYRRSRGDRRFFAAADIGDPVWQPDIPILLISPHVSRRMTQFVSPGALATPLAALVPLNTHLTATIKADVRDVPVANVGGIIRGTDPSLRDDIIVYTAHYDHLGISTPDARGDSIFNGFSDNAAGCAMLLAIAKAFMQNPPARSVAFLFFTGEERGLLGSSYMAASPPFALSRIKALINLDAGAPPAPPISWRIAGGVESGQLGALAAEVAAKAGWTAVSSGASPNSDYWPFLHRGVPAVFIVPGNEWENTTSAQRDALRARWDRYHQAGDEWAADFPFSGLARYATYALELGRAVANGSTSPLRN